MTNNVKQLQHQHRQVTEQDDNWRSSHSLIFCSETTTLSTTPVFAAPNDQGTVNNSAAPLPPPNPASNVAVGIITAPTVSSNAQPDNETSKTNPPGPCPVGFADKLASIRDYAFMDCSEVYLSGKRTSGTYEIWLTSIENRVIQLENEFVLFCLRLGLEPVRNRFVSIVTWKLTEADGQ